MRAWTLGDARAVPNARVIAPNKIRNAIAFGDISWVAAVVVSHLVAISFALFKVRIPFVAGSAVALPRI